MRTFAQKQNQPRDPTLFNLRETNCVHAALVELQTTGASDFWMKGEATVPLSLFRGGTPPPHPHPGGAGGISGSTF